MSSWGSSLLAFAATAALLGATLALARDQASSVDAWGQGPQLVWDLVALSGWALAGVFAIRTFSQRRHARLYAFVVPLLPLGLLHFLRFAHGAEQTLLPAAIAPLVPRPALLRAHEASFLLAPAALLAASLVPAGASRQLAGRFAALVVLLEVAVCGAAVALDWHLGDLPHAPWVALGAAGLAIVLSLPRWNADGAVAGAMAGLVLFPTAAALVELGLVSSLLPRGTAPLLLHVLPLVLLGILLVDWAASLSHRTSHDALTQIYNKAYAEAIVNQTAAVRLGERFAVAILDIDHFKKVNDTHGHGAGDDVLHHVAQAIRAGVAPRGVTCRTGGEEMTVFFPGLTPAEAAAACEQVRQRVAALRIRTRNNAGKSLKLEVTVSVGVAGNAAEGGAALAGVREVVEAADRALYTAKREGRDRVVIDAGQ